MKSTKRSKARALRVVPTKKPYNSGWIEKGYHRLTRIFRFHNCVRVDKVEVEGDCKIVQIVVGATAVTGKKPPYPAVEPGMPFMVTIGEGAGKFRMLGEQL